MLPVLFIIKPSTASDATEGMSLIIPESELRSKFVTRLSELMALITAPHLL